MVKLRTRLHNDAGVTGTARSDRRTSALLSRLSSGDVAVLDQVDLDGPTAEALVDAGVVAVVNRSPMISGRFPNRGPQLLVDAGIAMVDQATATQGRDLMSAVTDGRRVVLRGGTLLAGDAVVAEGRELTPDDVARQLADAEAGLSTQLRTLTHNSAEFLRREEALILHGEGVPRLRTRLRGQPVVVVAQGPDDAAELRRIRRYLREVRPVVVSTADGLAVAAAAGLTPDVVVIDSRTEDLPAAKALRACRDVVVTEAPGDTRPGRAGSERFERMGVRIVAMQTTATPADAALLLADAGGATPIIGVGLRGTVEEFLDGPRDGLGSGYVTRLRVGPRLVDATAVPMLYSGQLRARHAYLVLLIGLIVVAAAISTTDIGHQWAVDLGRQLDDLLGGRLS
ncbi:MAG TPA: putative cytokinetic ring protein SteA [Nocardioides sp.]|uniref:putative cytokinetic ring protein SteA n=1 Tax=Nocardioides sp. TaxID=35761 RepID=UPI002F42CE77